VTQEADERIPTLGSSQFGGDYVGRSAVGSCRRFDRGAAQLEGAIGCIQSAGEWVALGMLSLVTGLVIAFRGLVISIARRRNGDVS